MFCSKLDCDSVIDLRKAGRRRRVTCTVCNAASCKLCRQEFHGEWSRCPTENGIEEWRRNQPNSLTANCPKCGCFIEKNMGCPQMHCAICGHDFCWICGFSLYGWFHKIQGDSDGPICDIMNDLSQELRESACLSHFCVFYPLAFLMIVAGPPVTYALFIALMPIGWVIYFFYEGCSWSAYFACNNFMCVLLYPFAVVAAAIWMVIKIVGCTILATLALVFCYFMLIVFGLTIFCRFCLCKSHRSNMNNDRIDEMLV